MITESPQGDEIIELASAACATYAEVTKRGKEFWNEFEYYLSDLSVGLVLDVLLVGLMATPCVISKHHSAHSATGAATLTARSLISGSSLGGKAQKQKPCPLISKAMLCL